MLSQQKFYHQSRVFIQKLASPHTFCMFCTQPLNFYVLFIKDHHFKNSCTCNSLKKFPTSQKNQIDQHINLDYVPFVINHNIGVMHIYCLEKSHISFFLNVSYEIAQFQKHTWHHLASYHQVLALVFWCSSISKLSYFGLV